MRFPRSLLLVVVTMGILCLSVMGVLFLKPSSDDADLPMCRSIYMYPSYARLWTFDETYSKLAKKYSLYLYREQNVDYDPNDRDYLNGIPVLFIPGNAGSFRQVRSIAAETANLYFGGQFKENENSSHLDFFAADFNEDFTAFHGRTLMDQAHYTNDAIKYILKLYEKQDNAPQSVILVAHSMGGIVARVAVSLDGYIHDSVKSIITLSTPHSVAPLTFDGDVLRAYSITDRFWYEGFSTNNTVAHETLKDISIISITGGILDNTLPADYTTLGYLVPPSNGFTVYSTGIPGVWTPMDHLAIVWCDQFRRSIARVLLRIVDVNSPNKVYSLSERMKIFKQELLTGLEPNDASHLNQSSFDLNLYIRDIEMLNTMPPNTKKGKYYGFALQDSSSERFVSLSSKKFQPYPDEIRDEHLSIIACTRVGGNSNKVELKCIDLYQFTTLVPRSDTGLSKSSFGDEFEPYYAMKLDKNVLSSFDYLFISANIKDNDWIRADFFKEEDVSHELGCSLPLNLLGKSNKLLIKQPKSLVTSIYLPDAWSSLFSYNLKVIYENKHNFQPRFAPFLRQWHSNPYESKWHTRLDEKNQLVLTLHGIAPFTPFKVNENHGLNIELWTNVPEELNNREPIEVSVSINFIESMRLLLLRYRLALVSCTVSVTLLAFLFQYCHYIQNNSFPNILFGLNKLCSGKSLITVIILTSSLSAVVNKGPIQRLLDWIDPVVLQDPNEINVSLSPDFKVNSFYLGLEESNVIFLGPIFFAIGVSLVYATYHLITLLGTCITFFGLKLFRSIPSIHKEQKIKDSSSLDGNNENSNPMVRELSKSRIAANCLLIVMVPLAVPYQLAYVVCCFVQIFALIRILFICDNSFRTESINKSMINYLTTILVLMLWTLPINVPVLIVYVHNLAVNWTTPFSSHHNILAVLPILLLMERHSSGHMPPKTVALNAKFFTYGIIAFYVFYSIIYGIRHTFWLHHLFNVFSCWLLILCYSG